MINTLHTFQGDSVPLEETPDPDPVPESDPGLGSPDTGIPADSGSLLGDQLITHAFSSSELASLVSQTTFHKQGSTLPCLWNVETVREGGSRR